MVGSSSSLRTRCFWAALLVALAGSTCAAQTADEWAARRRLMVERDVATAGIKNAAVLAAMREIPRHEFVPAPVRPNAYFDMALPIGEHVTISPPFIVAWMTQELEPAASDRVLEIGTGSGYQAAVLSRLAREVDTIEINQVLAQRAGDTLARLGYRNVHVKHGDGYQGWPEKAPFDKIIVTCSPEKVPPALVDQLREGGRMVIPLGERYQQTLYTLVKQDGKLVTRSREPTFFVPMTGQAEARRTLVAQAGFTPLVNGGFERLLKPGQPDNWYYVRQAVVADGGAGGSGLCLAFANRVPGQNSQALQAIGVDGRVVSELAIDLSIKGEAIQPAKSYGSTGGQLVVSYFDENRSPAGQEVVGPWTGSFGWREVSGTVRVPRQARLAIVAVGLLGSTGRLWCDDVRLEPAGSRRADKRP
jgi:protein-L-isoaspartate(D-aspartate) O-methyltransferase